MGTNVIKTNESACKNGFKETCLIPPFREGSLSGLTFSVKDVFNLKGYKTGFGNPLWEKTHPVAVENAICIQQILANGASCVGKTIMGELGCGSTGANHFYGTPYNPRAPELVPGGSSSGSAVSVANGSVDFSLGTDAGGSVRIPSSFCGILGMRPSHGIISMAGVTSLAPSFDTVGVFASSMEVLSKVMSLLLDNKLQEKSRVGDIFIIDDLVQICSDEVKSSIKKVSDICFELFKKRPRIIKLNDIDEEANDSSSGIANTFLNVFCSETWTSISDWANEVKLEFGKSSYVDFSFMKNIDKEKIYRAFLKKEYFFKKLNDFLLPNNLFLIPTTPFAPVAKPANNTKINEFNYEKLRPLISLASVGRLPQLNIPILNQANVPLGISLVAAFKKDAYLIKIAEKIQRVLQDEI